MASGNSEDYEALKRVMDGFNGFVEQQAKMIHDLLEAVKDLSDRVARCEVSREETFRTRLDQLASEPTPEGPLREEETGYATIPSAERTSYATKDHELLIDLDFETNLSEPALGPRRQAPQAFVSESRNPESSVEQRPPSPRHIRPQPQPRATVQPPPCKAMYALPHSTPLRTPEVRFRDTFSMDDPKQRSLPPAPTPAPTKIKVSPQVYDGKQPWRIYRRHYEAVAKISGWPDEIKALYLIPFLRGTTLTFYDTLSEAVRLDYKRLDAAFDARFSNRMEKTVAHIKLRGCVQTPREALKEFATRVQELATLAFEDGPSSTREAVALAQFIDGIADAEIQQRVRDALPITVEDALALAERIEASREATRICRRNVRTAVAEVLSTSHRPETTTTRQAPRNIPRTRQTTTRPATSTQNVVEKGVKGRIRVFLQGRNFGFITRNDNGENVFLHRNEIANLPLNAPVTLREGDEVQFDVTWTNRTPSAKNVSLILNPQRPMYQATVATPTPQPATFNNTTATHSTSGAYSAGYTTEDTDLNASPLTFRGQT